MHADKQRGKKCNEECEKEGKGSRERPLFEFCTEDVIASKTRATGWDESCCTEVRSESMFALTYTYSASYTQHPLYTITITLFSTSWSIKGNSCTNLIHLAKVC